MILRTVFLALILLSAPCHLLAQETFDKAWGTEAKVAYNTRGHSKLEVKWGPKNLSFITHAGYMSRMKHDRNSSFIPLFGFHTSDEDLLRSYEGYRFGGGLAFRFWSIKHLSFSFNGTLDYARLYHRIHYSTSSFSFGFFPSTNSPFPFYLDGDNHSYSKDLTRDHLFLNLSVDARLHIRSLYLDFSCGIDPDLQSEPVSVAGPDNTLKEKKLLTDRGRLFIGIGLGWMF